MAESPRYSVPGTQYSAHAGGGVATDPRPGGAAGGGAVVAPIAPGVAPAFFELWYIWVSRSSAMCPVSIDTFVIRFRKKALKKMAGTDTAIPRNVIDRAAAMPSDSLAGFGDPPVDSDMNALIMPYTVPTNPTSGPSDPRTAV